MKHPFDYTRTYDSLLNADEILSRLQAISRGGEYSVETEASESAEVRIATVRKLSQKNAGRHPVATLVFRNAQSKDSTLVRAHVKLTITVGASVRWTLWGIGIFLLSMAFNARNKSFNFSDILAWLVLLPFAAIPVAWGLYLNYRFGKYAVSSIRQLLEEQLVLSPIP